MNIADLRIRDDRDDHRPSSANLSSSTHLSVSRDSSEFTLLVAGCRGGKTSFLRLLLDTCTISQRASKEQLASVAKFVQGCSSHTTHIRTTSIDIQHDQDPNRPLELTLVDTPSLDINDDATSERVMSETVRYVEGRFNEGVDADWGQHPDHFVHLCVYFLDPDQIVPLSIPAPPAPVVPRTRTNSFSQPDQEPVILEPPVTNNPLLYKPTLPAQDITTIRRLSARVNVLPVIARADVLSNDRISAIKMAVRHDLADAGIGFGIFDIDAPYQHPDDLPLSKPGEPSNGYGAQPNGSISSVNNSPPTSPTGPSLLRLPYALISPDIYSHSDGIPRMTPSRSDLIQTYTPSHYSHTPSKLARGKFTRNYRWGSLDVLDSNHCDFVHLRAAIFHHMETLQKYTREYLFEKFKTDYQLTPQQPPTRHSLTHPQRSHLSHVIHSTRPILAIDTASPHPTMNRQPSLNLPRAMSVGRDVRSAPISRNVSDSVSVKSNSSRSKQRTKKITVACNFCRSRKLKCDGGRPACGQCVKRSNPCDYMPQNKRRGAVRRGKDDESESETGEERSDMRDPSLSPQTSSQPLSRRSSVLDKQSDYGSSALPPITGMSSDLPSSSSRSRAAGPLMYETELPHIATLSLPDPSPSTPAPMSAPSLPPLRPASEQQAAQRKRAATVPGKTTRQTSHSGPKVVACNFCRARKTKCDGAHPACSSCARRSLPCNYVNDRNRREGAGGGDDGMKRGVRRTSATPNKPPSQQLAHPPADYLPSPPSSRMVPTPASAAGDLYERRDIVVVDSFDADLKRSSENMEASRPPKKMRVENSPSIADIP